MTESRWTQNPESVARVRAIRAATGPDAEVPVTVICAWCTRVLVDAGPTALRSHGICAPCRDGLRGPTSTQAEPPTPTPTHTPEAH
jgi:hypothetical protein